MLSSLSMVLRRDLSRGNRQCGHLDQIRDVVRGSEGCEQCLARGDGWVHLRMCMSCGQVGCCDSSMNTHARRHAEDNVPDHQIARSLERGENWLWCYADSTIVAASAVSPTAFDGGAAAS
jgi:uncharacterized UBP type Zn finger protein